MTNEVVAQARRVAKGLGWHPTASPCQCWTCQANRALIATADEIEGLRERIRGDHSRADKPCGCDVCVPQLPAEPPDAPFSETDSPETQRNRIVQAAVAFVDALDTDMKAAIVSKQAFEQWLELSDAVICATRNMAPAAGA